MLSAASITSIPAQDASVARLRNRAADARRLAGRIRGLDVSMLWRSGTTTTWVGPSQQRFEAMLRDDARRLQDAADQLAAAANRLDRRADELALLGVPEGPGAR